MFQRLVLFCTLALTVVSTAPSGAAVLSEHDAPGSVLQSAVGLYDPSGTLSVADVARSRSLVPASALPTFAEGYQPRVYWLRVSLDRGFSTAAWVLRYTYKVSRLDVYARSGGGFVHTSGGFDVAGRDEALAPNVLQLPEWALHGEPIYIRIATVESPALVRLAPLSAGLIPTLQRRGAFGFFVGFFLAIAVFNLLMFLSLRDRPLLNYAGVMLLYTARAAISFGALWMVLPPLTFLGRELIFDTVAIAANAALALFTVAFLRLAQRDVQAMRIVIAGAVVQGGVYVTDFFPSTTVAFDWTIVLTLVFYASLLFAGYRALRLGIRVAKIYSFGILATILGYLINMSSYGLPHQELWVYALEAGACIQAVLLAMAVAENVQESRAEHEQLVVESRHLAQLAMRDGLTGVLNRRSFDDALDSIVARVVAEHCSIGILILDIDHFKEYNDALGHQAGDEALRFVAQTCGACVRGGDIFARYGGEEFAAILADATMEDLEVIADRMCKALAALHIPRGDGAPLTVSIGGASEFAKTRDDAYAVLRAADSALYEAKSAGRNRVVLHVEAASKRATC